MNYLEFLTRVIDEGIAAARTSYTRPDQAEKLRGSIAGFEACRGKEPLELRSLLETAGIASADAYKEQRDDYWWYRCYAAEVEWVCNVVSAALYNQGLPVIVTPTGRGLMKAAGIVGVA